MELLSKSRAAPLGCLGLGRGERAPPLRSHPHAKWCGVVCFHCCRHGDITPTIANGW